MINTSSEFNNSIVESRNFTNYADITLADGTVLHLEPKDFNVGGNSIEDATTDGSQFAIGSTVAKYIKMSLINDEEQFSAYDFYNARIVLYVALKLSNTVEKLKKGTYTVNEPVTGGSTISISAIDDMICFDKDYSESKTAYPATLQTIMSDACLDCGVPIGFGQFDNRNFIVSEKPTDCTYRQVIAWVAQIAGYNARISVDNVLELIMYDFDVFGTNGIVSGGDFADYANGGYAVSGGDFTTWVHEDTISGGTFTDLSRYHVLYSFKNVTVATDDVVITGVKVIKEDTTYLCGVDDYCIVVTDNDMAAGQEQVVANYLGARFIGMRFRPFSGDHMSDPRIEAGDVAYVIDRKGRVYQTLITDCSFTTGGYTKIACSAESPIHNKSRYLSEATRAVAIARKERKTELTTYDKAVQAMNELAINSLGYYQTIAEQTDGSRITYIHNKPLLKDSQTIYKMTSSGFFVSTNGGASYTAGFDKDGNAVFNILNAVGVVCDWIRGGTLTLGGADNVNGNISMLDGNGKKFGFWNQKGFCTQTADFQPEVISKYAGTVYPGVGKKKVKFRAYGAPGCGWMYHYFSYNYFVGKVETQCPFDYAPSGEDEDGFPYWDITIPSNAILGQIQMMDNDEVGYCKRVQTWYKKKSKSRWILTGDVTYAAYSECIGMKADFVNGVIANRSFKLDSDGLYFGNKLWGQTDLLLSTGSTLATNAPYLPNSILDYSKIMVVCERVSDGLTISPITVSVDFFMNMEETSWLRNDNTNFAQIKQYVNADGDVLDDRIYFKVSSTDYIGKLYGIV